MAAHDRGGRTPIRFGYWAVIGLVFLGLSWTVEHIRGSQAQPAAPPAAAPPAVPAAAPAATAPAAPRPGSTCTIVSAVELHDEGGHLSVGVHQPPPAGRSKLRIDKPAPQKPFYDELKWIALLLVFIAFVISRLPRVELQHTEAFRRRRTLNWLPLGLTYAFLYMGRYNMTVLQNVGALSTSDYGDIASWGALVYGLSFVVNGPLTDRWGGRITILISASGTLVTNTIIGVLIATGHTGNLKTTFSLLYALNMYFQSFGAVSIVKVNAAWFHLRERGTFGGIFGILISLGLYFAYDWGFRIANAYPTHLEYLFYVPAAILAVFFVLCVVFVHDSPSGAGHPDFDVGDASSGQSLTPDPVWSVFARLLSSRIIIIITAIEFCSGFLRQAILQWYRDFAKGVGATGSFVYVHWGLVSCIAGITGGIFAGLISDHVFGSRRAPVAAVLYGLMLVGALVVLSAMGQPLAVSWTIAVMSMAIIGVHGVLSGTASADFGGRKNAGVAVGIIDGFVYLGTAFQAQVYGHALPEKGTCAARQLHRWAAWPQWMIPMAIVGLAFGVVLWNARPDKPKPPAAAV
ncbi:MAG TPA: MFS transporter [Kofleriaceae bacterium]|nr:MFS transporter [Kofleriaceae bacterium]